MFSTTWKTSARVHSIRREEKTTIPMSDGVTIDADVFRPDSSERFPAILGIQPYERHLQHAPIRPAGLNMANGGMEAGDYNFYVRRGYVHVIASTRGTGLSTGKYTNYGPREIQDASEMIEWIAAQPWCDGHVGMFGPSAFSVIQQQVAPLNPPHLKAVFCPFGYTDFYRDKFYHGGILSHAFMQGWVKTIDNPRYESWSLEHWGRERFNQGVAEAMADEDIRVIPYLAQALKQPEVGGSAMISDILLNPFDTEYFRERSVRYEKQPRVPAYLGGCWGIYGLHLPGAFRSWDKWAGPKKMIVGPPIYLDRPIYQHMYESLRFFDHWLKGADNGIMEEPALKLFIVNTGEWKFAEKWPLPETRWTPFYLHERGLMSEHEFWPNEGASTYEDSMFNREGLTFTSPPLIEKTEVVGPMAVHLYASSTDQEVLWFVSLWDVDPGGKETLLTRGWLRGSQRRLDETETKPWQPVHSHLRREPLSPNEVYEFDIELRPYGIQFQEGHQIRLKIKGVDDEKPNSFLQAIGSGHLWRQRPSRVTVFHNPDMPSHLLLPITKGNLLETFISGGKTGAEFFPYRLY